MKRKENKTMDKNKSYNTSRDYKHLKELLDNGAVVVGFTTYDFDRFNKDPNHTPIMTTDVLCAFKYQNQYLFAVRGLGYGDYDPAYHNFSFEAFCKSLKLEYIEPTKDVNTKQLLEKYLFILNDNSLTYQDKVEVLTEKIKCFLNKD